MDVKVPGELVGTRWIYLNAFLVSLEAVLRAIKDSHKYTDDEDNLEDKRL